ncbi:MAG: ABC-F family ATP-binding cassette domain-containing protein [Dehalococcoidia bacterium]|nr:ABC-F family ATP-binding cassette domain-containing protein [Dehalococcoidia bacterium]
MLFADRLTKSFGSRDLLKDVSFSIAAGERVALVGSNGAGKTTLLRMLADEESPTSGSAGHRGGSLGYLKQESGFDPDNTLEAEAWTAFPEARAIELRIQEVERRLVDAADDPAIDAAALSTEQLGLYERYDLLDGHTIGVRVDRVLRGLGFKTTDRAKLCGAFSGGWRMRIALAKVLVRRPDHMLLDEPTNHLDESARGYLARELTDYQGTLVLVTHDSAFLDKVVKRVLEVGDSGVASYTGNYTKYLQQKEKRSVLQEQAASRQERKIAKQEVFINRFRAGTKASLAQSREKQLAKVVRLERPREAGTARFSITSLGRVEQKVVTLASVSHAYDDDIVLVDVSLTVERGQKVVLVGPNGSGKSTLLRIAAGQVEPLEGTVAWAEHARFGYYEQHQDEALDPERTVLEEVQSVAGTATEGTVRNVLGKFLFKGDDVFKPVSVLSGGERSRVALAKFLIQPTNVLLLDEPTNHLDRATRESLVTALKGYDGTIMCATHDQDILDSVATHVYEVRGGACVNTRIITMPIPVKQQSKKKK